MRFMIMVRANAQSESEPTPMPSEELMAAMATYHEELAKAGILLDANGLQPSSKGWRVRYENGGRRVIDGPFAEAKELIAGYTLIQVKLARGGARVVAPLPGAVRGPGAVRDRGPPGLSSSTISAQGEGIERFRELDAARQG